MTHIIFVRHGKTRGNLQGRYIGRTDEPLCAEGIAEIKARANSCPTADLVICSPMKRCRETAALLYPDREVTVFDGLRECDFGDFEGKNYTELSRNADYVRWLDSGGTLPFPNGEAHQDFQARCVSAFEQAMESCACQTVAFVVHGGTIMSILEAYAVPKKGFFDYQVKNGRGYLTDFDGEKLIIQGEL